MALGNIKTYHKQRLVIKQDYGYCVDISSLYISHGEYLMSMFTD
jgi:hypothetical protein